jgi:hypothetical protein
VLHHQCLSVHALASLSFTTADETEAPVDIMFSTHRRLLPGPSVGHINISLLSDFIFYFEEKAVGHSVSEVWTGARNVQLYYQVPKLPPSFLMKPPTDLHVSQV